jgi:hypothetical protein
LHPDLSPETHPAAAERSTAAAGRGRDAQGAGEKLQRGLDDDFEARNMTHFNAGGPQETPDIEKYVAIMKEIKLRTDVINAFLSGQCGAVYTLTTVETVGLQFRKIFELIAFASLAANQRKYSAAYADFSKHWEAAKLLKSLHRINPDFYPKPVVETKSDHPDVVHGLNDRDQDYLTQAHLIEAHGRCGKLLHAANPFGKPIDYAFFQTSFPVWRNRFMNLLNNHKIHLVGDTGFYLVHMHEEGKKGEVSWYRFEPVNPSVSSTKADLP